MHLPKLSFSTGLTVSVVAGASWFIGWPLLYDKFGQGAADAREVFLSTEDLPRICGSKPKLLIVPWELGLEDSERRGELDVGYWALCDSGLGHMKMSFFHQGGAWIFKAGNFRKDGIVKNFVTKEK